MSDIITFLTSEEIIMVYAIAFFSALLCLVIYIAQKTYDKRNQKHNTMELNRLVEQIQEKIEEEKETVAFEKEEAQPVIIEEDREEQVVPVAIIPELPKEVVMEVEQDTKTDAMLKQLNPVVEEKVEDSIVAEEIQYENVEPDQTVAQQQLEKLTEELQQAESEVQNIELTKFEEEQEENAIISLDELLAKGTTLYEKNEVTQYQDEGNEPITLQDLEARMKQFKENIEEIKEKEEVPIVIEKEEVPVSTETPRFTQTSLPLDEVNTETKPYQAAHTFKSSPVISPIYGIEGKQSIHKQTELELENTATLKKFDDEIRKTNEFVMTLKELQKNLE